MASDLRKVAGLGGCGDNRSGPDVPEGSPPAAAKPTSGRGDGEAVPTATQVAQLRVLLTSFSATPAASELLVGDRHGPAVLAQTRATIFDGTRTFIDLPSARARTVDSKRC